MFQTELDKKAKDFYGRKFIWLTQTEQKTIMEALQRQTNIQTIQPNAQQILQKAEAGNPHARKKILNLVNDTLWLQKQQEKYYQPRLKPCL